MSTIYDALIQAEKDHLQQSPVDRSEDLAPPKTSSHLTSPIREQLYSIYQAVAAEKSEGGTVLTFVGARAGEGVSTLVREFAKLASTEMGDRVLLLDGDHGNGRHCESLGVGLSEDCEAVVAGRKKLSDALVAVIEDRLMLGAVTLNGTFTASITASRQFNEMLEKIRQQFDLVLFDAPPVTISSQALAFTRASDGVVLVVKAESTRWQAVKQAKIGIERAGGRVIGVILSKTRHHIPEFIYRRL